MSHDGRKRVDVRITHRLDGGDFANILCLRHREDDEDGVEALPDYSRATIVDIVRAQLTKNADAPNWWQDDLDDTPWIGELWVWAMALVARRFPEFK